MLEGFLKKYIFSGRLDLLSALVSAGCCHLAIKILDYLDSTSLLAASLVCTGENFLLIVCLYSTYLYFVFDTI